MIDVSIVIPTLGETARAEALRRAISSVANLKGCRPEALVVVNGNRFSAALLEDLKSTKGVRVLQIAEAGISPARLHGRRNVRSPYFMMLDDDDELLPHAVEQLHSRLEAAGSDTGLVLGDAFNTGWQGRYGFTPSQAGIEKSPIEALTKQNWLILQSSLFRTSAVPAELFHVNALSNECTLIAYNLCLAGVKIAVLDEIVAVVHNDAQVPSESKTERFITQEPLTLKAIFALELPQPVRITLERKLSAAYHYNAEYYLRRRQYGKSWANHLRSLAGRGGLRYLSFTRLLLRPPKISA